MAVTQDMRLEAVLSKLESVENEFRQTKRILQHILFQFDTRSTEDRTEESKPILFNIGNSHNNNAGDREGLFPGQLDYSVEDRPSTRSIVNAKIALEETGTCAT